MTYKIKCKALKRIVNMLILCCLVSAGPLQSNHLSVYKWRQTLACDCWHGPRESCYHMGCLYRVNLTLYSIRIAFVNLPLQLTIKTWWSPLCTVQNRIFFPTYFDFHSSEMDLAKQMNYWTLRLLFERKPVSFICDCSKLQRKSLGRLNESKSDKKSEIAYMWMNCSQ